jgi:hypothetical protein
MSYTLGEAAKAVGKSKATISKAIKSGKISASKNDDGSFTIEASELHRVYPPTPSTVESEQYSTPDSTRVNTYEKDKELIELRVRLEAANQRISDLEKDKEDWKQQATRLLTHQQNTNGGILRRLFSK